MSTALLDIALFVQRAIAVTGVDTGESRTASDDPADHFPRHLSSSSVGSLETRSTHFTRLLPEIEKIDATP